MNSLQLELDNINQQLELLTYRKIQLDSIIAEYSDVINRVKSLVSSMEDANVEPSNLLMEIEGIVFNVEEPQQPKTTDNHTKINSHIIPFDPQIHGELEPESTPETTPEEQPTEEPILNSLGLPVTPEQRGNSLLFKANTYWDNGSSVRIFIPKKRRYKGELENIVKDCIGQGFVEQFDINESGDDWIVQLSPVTDEITVNNIINEFYPQHTDGEPEQPKTSNPELVKLMACVPTVATPEPVKTQLNDQAYRRGDTLLIGFSNKRLMNSWEKWIKNNWGDSVKVWNDESLEGFTHCLSVLWYGSSRFIDWKRLSNLNYSFKPDEQPTGISLDDVRNVIQTLQNNGVKFISKGELLAHHLNSLNASDLEEYLDKLADEGLIALGNKSIDLLPAKTQENEPDNPTFEYTEIDSKTTKVYNNGMLLGIAKNCGTHWESPQCPGQTFPNRRDVVAGLWQLVNQF